MNTSSIKDLPKTGETNQELQERMQQRFTQIQAQIDELSEKLQESPNLALHLDVMVSETLAQQGIRLRQASANSEEARQAGEERSQAVLDWMRQVAAGANEGEKRKDALIKGGGTAATAILGLLALISGPLGWSKMVAGGLGFGAGATGTATQLYEQPQLDVQDLGAQSGEAGGQQLTSMDPEEARFARILGRVNVVLGILDMGLEVGALSRLIKQPGAMSTLSKLQPEQLRQFEEVTKLRQAGQTEAAEEVLGHLRADVGDDIVDQVVAASGGLLFSQRELVRGNTPLSEELLQAMQREVIRDGKLTQRREVVIASPGSDNERMLDFFGANASVNTNNPNHILLRADARKIEAIEEYLHGTQMRLGIIEKIGDRAAEIHVKEFMIRHHQLLGLSTEDVAPLIIMRDSYTRGKQ